jgi:hypothetical protein
MHTNEWIEEQGLRNTRRRKEVILIIRPFASNPTTHQSCAIPSLLLLPRARERVCRERRKGEMKCKQRRRRPPAAKKETGSRRKETESGQEQAEENKGIWGSNNTPRA